MKKKKKWQRELCEEKKKDLKKMQSECIFAQFNHTVTNSITFLHSGKARGEEKKNKKALEKENKKILLTPPKRAT